MPSTILLSDNGASSGSAGLKQTAGNDGVLILQTTTSGGTATNAVYVNNSQNVGFRTTPAAWGSAAKAIQIGARGSLFEYNGATTDLMNNGYFDGTNYVYLETATAAFHRMATGRHQLYSAASNSRCYDHLDERTPSREGLLTCLARWHIFCWNRHRFPRNSVSII